MANPSPLPPVPPGCRGIGLDEWLEEAWQGFFRDPGARVDHVDPHGRLAVQAGGQKADCDLHFAPLRELDAIADHIDQGLSEPKAIGDYLLGDVALVANC